MKIEKLQAEAEKYKVDNVENDVVDLSKNFIIDKVLDRYYKTYEVTKDTDHLVNAKDNVYIRKYIFKNFKKALKWVDLYYKGYIFAQEQDSSTYFYKVNQQRLWTKFCNSFKKIFKGNKKNLPLAKTEGYMYITEDSGDIYVDTSNSARIQLNANYANAFREADTNSPIKLDQTLINGNDITPIYLSNQGKPQLCQSLVSLNTTQTITGQKTFQNSLNIGNCSLQYDNANNCINFIFN